MKKNDLAFELDWGIATIDFYNGEDKLAIHVINHNVEDKEHIDLTIQFVIGKIKWFSKHLPLESKQAVKIDDRGQNISDIERNYIRNSIEKFCSSVTFFSEDI